MPKKWICVFAIVVIGFAARLSSLGSRQRADAATIFAAIRYQEEAQARDLIAKHPECINSRDFNGELDMDHEGHTRGWTMLHLAALTCQPSIVETLIKHGADVNADVRGVTPLDAVIGINPAQPSLLDVMQFRDGYGGRIQAVATLLRAHGAKGTHFDKMVKATGAAERSPGVQNMDAIISNLGG